MFQLLTLDNAEDYIRLTVEFCLYTGIRRQMDAFKGRAPYTLENPCKRSCNRVSSGLALDEIERKMFTRSNQAKKVICTPKVIENV